MGIGFAKAAPPLLYALRLWAAVCLALFVAFSLELDNPFWAGTSAAIVCQLQLGLRCVRVRNAHQSGHRPTPVVDRLHLRFAAVAFSAVVSLMPGFFLFNAATGLVELVSIGPTAPAALLTSIATSGAAAFLIIMTMTFGLILPRMLFERVMPFSV